MATKKVITSKPKPAKPQGTSPRNFVIPVAFPNAITSVFNDARNYRWAPNRLQLHEGVDFAPPRNYTGDLPVIAAAAGRVVAVRNDPRGYGNYVVIQHDNQYQSLYGHLANVAVRVGDILTQGQRLGTAGNTGNSSGTHLHFNIIDTTRSRGNYVYGGVVDPLDFLGSAGNTARSTTPISSKPTSPISRNRRQDNPPTPAPLIPFNQFTQLQQQYGNDGSGPTTFVMPSFAVTNPSGQLQVVANAVEDFPNQVSNSFGIGANIQQQIDASIENVKEEINTVIPFVFMGIIALAIAVISAYKFIKD